MAETIKARDLQPGDYIKTPTGVGVFHRVPRNRSQQFTAAYRKSGKIGSDGSVTYEPDEDISVLCRWPLRFGENV